MPLSPAAVTLLEQLRGIDQVKVFTVPAGSRDALFRKAVKRAEICDADLARLLGMSPDDDELDEAYQDGKRFMASHLRDAILATINEPHP